MNINTDPVHVSPYISPATTPLGGKTSPQPGGVPPLPIMHPHHMDAYVLQSMSETNVWALLMFPLILAGLFMLLVRHWWQGSLILLFTTSFLMATYYAKRPRIQHRLANILCAIFFVTFRDASNQRPPRRFLRISVAFAISILSVILFVWPRSGATASAHVSATPPAQTEPAAPRP